MAAPLARRVSAPPEWAPREGESPGSSTIDPVYMIQQIAALHSANQPPSGGGQAEGSAAGAAARGGDSDDEGGEEAEPSVAAAKRLWDLASEASRAAFLMEHHLHTVALGVLGAHERQRPRLCELCMGTLANLASLPEIAPTLATDEELLTIVLRVWMTCPDALVLSETARLHLAFVSNPTTAEGWRAHLGADEPLNQLVCLAMSAKEPLLLARLCALLQQMLRDIGAAYHLVAHCHLAPILTHLLDAEVPKPKPPAGGATAGTKRGFDEAEAGSEEAEGMLGGLREGALGATPWNRGSAREFGQQTATLADESVDGGGLQSALFFLLHAAEVLAFYSQEAVVAQPEAASAADAAGPPSASAASAAASASAAGGEGSDATAAPPRESQAQGAAEEGAEASAPRGVRCCPASALAREPALPRVLSEVVRRTKGKGGLGRAALATLDYLLSLPEAKGGWPLEALPGAARALAVSPAPCRRCPLSLVFCANVDRGGFPLLRRR